MISMMSLRLRVVPNQLFLTIRGVRVLRGEGGVVRWRPNQPSCKETVSVLDLVAFNRFSFALVFVAALGFWTAGAPCFLGP